MANVLPWLLAIAAFASPFVTWFIFQTTRSDHAQEKKVRSTLDEATLAISTWKELTKEFESQVRAMQVRLEACAANEDELRQKIAELMGTIAELRTRISELEAKIARLTNGGDK